MEAAMTTRRVLAVVLVSAALTLGFSGTADAGARTYGDCRSEEHTSELQSHA